MSNARKQTREKNESTKRVKGRTKHRSTRHLILLLLLRGLLGRRGVVLRVPLLVHLLEETKGGLLGLVDLLTDGVGGSGRVTGLALRSELTEVSEVLGHLVLLGLIELVLELVHG